MKTFIDKLREMATDDLVWLIKKQKREIEIAQRDLEQMERVLKEKENIPTEDWQNLAKDGETVKAVMELRKAHNVNKSPEHDGFMGLREAKRIIDEYMENWK